MGNLYAPLMGYPQVVRVVALSGGYDLEESNKRLSQNAGMIASFSRTLREGLKVTQTDEEFTKTLGATLDAVTEASKAPIYGSQVKGNAVKEEQLKKMTNDPGFISALDESGGTSPKTLAAYGITDKDYKDHEDMLDRGLAKGIWGTKQRSQIQAANPEGIKKLV